MNPCSEGGGAALGAVDPGGGRGKKSCRGTFTPTDVVIRFLLGLPHRDVRRELIGPTIAGHGHKALDCLSNAFLSEVLDGSRLE